MISETFAQGASLMHAIDPRLRLIAAIGYACIVAVAKQPLVLTVALVIGVGLVLTAQLNLWAVIKKLAGPLLFVLFFWLVTPFTFVGAPLLSIGPLTVYLPGVILCVQISVKSIAILLAFVGLVATMPIATLGHALQRLRIPPKLVFLLLMTYRYIDVLQTEYQRIAQAAKIRGFHPQTRLHTYQTYAYMVGMLFVRAAQRSENVNRAMRCRGFCGRFYSIFTFPPHPCNPWFALISLGILLGLISLEWMGP